MTILTPAGSVGSTPDHLDQLVVDWPRTAIVSQNAPDAVATSQSAGLTSTNITTLWPNSWAVDAMGAGEFPGLSDRVRFEGGRFQLFGITLPLLPVFNIARGSEGATGWLVKPFDPATLLEVGIGFHPELTGRENVILHGTLMGFSRRDMEGRMVRIAESTSPASPTTSRLGWRSSKARNPALMTV